MAPWSIARAVCVLGTVAVLASGCARFSAGPIVVPTAAAPGWQVITTPQALVAVSLPPSWKVVDPAEVSDNALALTDVGQDLASQLHPVIGQLQSAGVRFFAFDPTTPVGDFDPPQFPALAFVVRSTPAADSLDSFAARLAPEPPGRELLDVRHTTGVVGDILIRRVRETRIRPDGSLEITIQYQCVVIRSGVMSILNMQVPESAFGQYEQILDRIAGSFAPF